MTAWIWRGPNLGSCRSWRANMEATSRPSAPPHLRQRAWYSVKVMTRDGGRGREGSLWWG